MKGVNVSTSGSDIQIACAGLDQRLCIWRFDHRKGSEQAANAVIEVGSDGTGPPLLRTRAHQEHSPLIWIAGKPIAVADVSCVQMITRMRTPDKDGTFCTIVGEGMEFMQIEV